MRSIAGIAAILSLVSNVRADDWPQWLGPQRDGVWREQGILEKFPTHGPKVLWRKPVGGGYGGPAIADGRLFVMDRPATMPASNASASAKKGEIAGSERVLCLDEKTGEALWQYQYECPYAIGYNSGPRCTPTVDGDRAYTLGAMGNLFCFSVADGKILWQKDFAKDYQASKNIWGYAGHPLVEGDQLICVVGGNNNRLVVSFDKKTGKELWTSQQGDKHFGYGPPTILTFGKNRQLVVWHGKQIVALNPANGEKQWAVDFEVNYALTAPTPRKVDDDKVFITSFYNGSKLIQVDPSGKSARIVWQGKSNSERPDKTEGLHSIMMTPSVKDGFIYGVCSYGQLRCLDASTGKRIWETMKATRGAYSSDKTKASEGPTTGERWSNAFIIENGSRFFLFNEQGELIIAELSPSGYREIDRASIIEPTNNMANRPVVWMHPAFANRNMYAKNDREIVAISLAK